VLKNIALFVIWRWVCGGLSLKTVIGKAKTKSGNGKKAKPTQNNIVAIYLE